MTFLVRELLHRPPVCLLDTLLLCFLYFFISLPRKVIKETVVRLNHCPLILSDSASRGGGGGVGDGEKELSTGAESF